MAHEFYIDYDGHVDGAPTTVLSTLTSRSTPAVAALDTVLERFAGANPLTGGNETEEEAGLGDGGYR